MPANSHWWYHPILKWHWVEIMSEKCTLPPHLHTKARATEKYRNFTFSFPASLILPGCFVSDMCCEATCVKTNVTGEAALHLSVYQPPVIRTLHMKAMTDKTEGRRKKKTFWDGRLSFTFHPRYPFVCLPFLKSRRNIQPALSSPQLHLPPSHSLKTEQEMITFAQRYRALTPV